MRRDAEGVDGIEETSVRVRQANCNAAERCKLCKEETASKGFNAALSKRAAGKSEHGVQIQISFRMHIHLSANNSTHLRLNNSTHSDERVSYDDKPRLLQKRWLQRLVTLMARQTNRQREETDLRGYWRESAAPASKQKEQIVCGQSHLELQLLIDWLVVRCLCTRRVEVERGAQESRCCWQELRAKRMDTRVESE